MRIISILGDPAKRNECECNTIYGNVQWKIQRLLRKLHSFVFELLPKSLYAKRHLEKEAKTAFPFPLIVVKYKLTLD